MNLSVSALVRLVETLRITQGKGTSMHYHIIMKTKLKDKSVLHKNTFKQDNSFGVKPKKGYFFFSLQ